MQRLLASLALLSVLAYALGGGYTPPPQSTRIRQLANGTALGHSRTSCAAPACGTALQTFNGVTAYSNGANQCSGYSCAGYGTYGYQYQCVELAQRYFSTLFGTPAIWYANAIDMCTSHPAGLTVYYQGSGYSPRSGDLIVLNTDPPYGHVAVVTSYSGSTVYVIEQNADGSGKNAYSYSSGYCYITAGGGTNNGGGVSCAGKSNGYYCGDNGLGGDARTLYLCMNGQVSASSACSSACVHWPAGYDDTCADGSCSGLANGYYCGNNGPRGSDPNTLYLCSAGAVSSAQECVKGCAAQQQGYNDYCY
eukprot:TRINITY_DN6058_c0_g1_i1.p1 TRINITY_DN6058_c0_g1~~TRINITY_DN6058_c0_g1_i1.p1  ORF type:complete len:314 (-),score=63.02 TRINITY_DN6058_c0_g1_i1:220-1140(-)